MYVFFAMKMLACVLWSPVIQASGIKVYTNWSNEQRIKEICYLHYMEEDVASILFLWSCLLGCNFMESHEPHINFMLLGSYSQVS